MPNPATPEAVATLRAHPRFQAAMRNSAAGIVARYQGGRLVNWLMDDRGRLLFGYLALYLHFSRRANDPASGLTPTRMKVLCSELEVCSPGRAVAMLSLMRFGGYLAPAPAADGRLHVLMATDRLVTLLVERQRIHLSALAELVPEGRAALVALDDPAFLRRFTIAMFERYHGGFRLITHAPDLGLFGERSAGMLILASLITAGEADDAVPPTRPVPISVSALARRFHVSRPHVLKLLNEVADEGFIERIGPAGDRIVVLPRLSDAAQSFFATAFLFLADCAREALSEREPANAAG